MSEKITIKYQDSLNEDENEVILVPDIADVTLVNSTDNEELCNLKNSDRQGSDDSLELFTNTLNVSPDENREEEIIIKVPQPSEYKRQESFSSTIVIDLNGEQQKESIEDKDAIEDEADSGFSPSRIRDSIELTQTKMTNDVINLTAPDLNDRPISVFTQSVKNFDNIINEFEDYDSPVVDTEEVVHQVHFKENMLKLSKIEEAVEEDNHSIDKHVENMKRSIKELDEVFQTTTIQTEQEKEEKDEKKETVEKEEPSDYKVTFRQELKHENVILSRIDERQETPSVLEINDNIKQEEHQEIKILDEKQSTTEDRKKKKVSFLRTLCCF
ncbi:DgyrCDS4549 [Dimorphilus gyrociliatus]|uniref:DgyrCDS4549 n=1 Tax=Dimorphilus gyrociliatus TaxID=2664684 RepID=A0A7I8VHD1_9ANNE|nr:DgyrCDS4549 [Dimorphilus gyrociliatus]